MAYAMHCVPHIIKLWQRISVVSHSGLSHLDAHKTFVEAVESGSFSAAAKRLHKSPSAISKHMAALEEKLGVQLFVRTTRSLQLTEAGELYYQRSKDIVRRMEATHAELMEFQGQPTGSITVTWPNALSYGSISQALAEFAAQNPGIRIHVRASTDVVNLVEDKVDFAFRVSRLTDSNLIAIQLDTLQPMICASPAWIARHGTPTSLEALFALPNVLPTYVNLTQKKRGFFAGIKEFNLAEHHTVDDITSLYNLARQGLGAAFLFQHVVQEDLESGRLINLTKAQPLAKVPLYLVYPKLDFQPQKIRAFIDHLKVFYRL